MRQLLAMLSEWRAELLRTAFSMMMHSRPILIGPPSAITLRSEHDATARANRDVATDHSIGSDPGGGVYSWRGAIVFDDHLTPLRFVHLPQCCPQWDILRAAVGQVEG